MTDITATKATTTSSALDENDVRVAMKLLRLRETELTVENRLVVERRLKGVAPEVLTEAKIRRLHRPEQPEVHRLSADVTSKEVSDFVGQRATLTATKKGTDGKIDKTFENKDQTISQAPGAASAGLQKDIHDDGIMNGLLKFFEAVDDKGVVSKSSGVMKAIRLISALGKSDEAAEFLTVAREHTRDVKRLMANRPEDLTKLLEQGEFGAMTALVLQEVNSPGSLLSTVQDAHQFREHGAHNPAVEMVIMSFEATRSDASTGPPKSTWVTAAAEQDAVEWAESKIAAEVDDLKAGTLPGAGSEWAGDLATAAAIMNDNASAATEEEKWTLKDGALKPMQWSDFVANADIFDQKQTFVRKVKKGPKSRLVTENKALKPVFRQPTLKGTAADIGVTGSVAGRRVKVERAEVPALPKPLDHPMLTDPEITLTQGSSYYYQDQAKTWKLTLVEFDLAPAITTFKAVFRKTTDPDLTYRVYTVYPG